MKSFTTEGVESDPLQESCPPSPLPLGNFTCLVESNRAKRVGSLLSTRAVVGTLHVGRSKRVEMVVCELGTPC